MMVTVDIEINAPASSVWQAITDIEHCQGMIAGILNIEILEKPADSLVGLKWRETREMFGKETTETMWVTEAQDTAYYCTRAESHGSVYLTRLDLKPQNDITSLTMTFTAEAQSLVAKIMSFIMRPLITGSIKKALTGDLQDIKHFVENKTYSTT